VEPVGDPGTRRWLMLYDVYMDQVPAAPGPVRFQPMARGPIAPAD